MLGFSHFFRLFWSQYILGIQPSKFAHLGRHISHLHSSRRRICILANRMQAGMFISYLLAFDWSVGFQHQIRIPLIYWVQTMWEDLLHRTTKEPWHSSMKTKGILLRTSQIERIQVVITSFSCHGFNPKVFGSIPKVFASTFVIMPILYLLQMVPCVPCRWYIYIQYMALGMTLKW